MGQIQVFGVGKFYKRYEKKWHRLAEWLSGGKVRLHEAHWVLREISFSVAPGESVGLIGHNGAGKSTLLKILTGTSRPSTGEVQVHGRVAALLELGMGFHPEFTGRQNAVTAAQMMGLAGQEIADLMPAIEAFAEIGDYLDQPIRTYSSGMAVRLGFAVATAVRPDVLIVDEALSVGDAYFQHKCFARIRDYREQGTTMLFVSHDPAAVKSLCNRALLLDGGLLVREGAPDEVLDYYNAMIARREADYSIQQSQGEGSRTSTRSGNGAAAILGAEFMLNGAKVGAACVGAMLELVILVVAHRKIDHPTVGMLLKDRLGNEVFGTNTHHLGVDLGCCQPSEKLMVRFRFPLNLGVGHYSLTVAMHAGHAHTQENYDWWDQAATLQVVPGEQASFVGLCYLPVACEVGPS